VIQNDARWDDRMVLGVVPAATDCCAVPVPIPQSLVPELRDRTKLHETDG